MIVVIKLFIVNASKERKQVESNPLHSTHTQKPRIHNYQLLSLLGQGGMGKVYKAIDLQTRQTVALKVLISDNSRDINSVRRFLKEIHAISQLQHPNIIRLLHSGQQNGIPYFVMELIDGITLKEWLEQNLSLRKRVVMMTKIGQAVHYAHEQGIIHRDLKPENIMIRAGNEPCIMDFGLVKFSEDVDNLTQTGGILGTLYYMSPEQAEGRKREIDHRTDIYALGAIFYEFITKSPPFVGANATAIIKKICSEPVIPPSHKSAKISKQLDKICLKALAKQPQDRYANLALFLQDLQDFTTGKRIKTRIPKKFPLRTVLAGIAIITFTLAIIFLWPSAAIPEKQIVMAYYKLKSEAISGVDVESRIKTYTHKWGKFAFFHQKMAQLYFYLAFVNDELFSKRLIQMKNHIAMAQKQPDSYNFLLQYQYLFTQGKIPQSLFANLAKHQNEIARKLGDPQKEENKLSFIENTVRDEWLQAIQFPKTIDLAHKKIPHITIPLLRYHHRTPHIQIKNYSVFVRGQRVSEVNEAVYLAATDKNQLRYLAVCGDAKIIEVSVDLTTLDILNYKDIGNTPRVKRAKVKWNRLSEMLTIFTGGFIRNFYRKSYQFIIPKSQLSSQRIVNANPQLKKLFHLYVDPKNFENSLHLMYRDQQVNSDDQFVMAAGLANHKVIYLQ